MKKVPLRHLLLCAVVAALIGGNYLSMFGSIGGGDWTGKPTEAELRAATETFELPSGIRPTNVRFLPKVTFMSVVFDAELESDPEQSAAFFIKQAAEKHWRLQKDKRQRHYRLMVFCEDRLAHSVELTTRGSTVKLYGGTYWDSDRGGDYYCSPEAR